MKRVIISVTNDLVTDQRVDRVANTLVNLGFDVLLVGRRKRDSMQMADRLYNTCRMKLLFEKGALFYAEFNIRLFVFLLFHKKHLLVSNDLDTLLPNFIIHKIFRKPIVYDSHEYFTGVPELENRKFVKSVWRFFEKSILPKLKYSFTINDSIAKLYNQEYGIKMKVVRNIPYKRDIKTTKSKEELGLPRDKKILLLQGAGINIDRGVEEMIEAMQYIDNSLLLIIGDGDVIHLLKQMVLDLELNDKVMFLPKLPFERLFNYTVFADIGLTLDKDTNINYRFSLPNKLFDYIRAGVPVFASDLPEVRKIVERYGIGEIFENHDPRYMAQRLNYLLNDVGKLKSFREKLNFASSELCWENEEKELINVYKQFV